LRVAIVSSSPLIYAGLAILLSAMPDRAVVVDDDLDGGRPRRADVVVYDLAGTRPGPSEHLARLLASQMSVVALSRSEESDLEEPTGESGIAEVVTLAVTAGQLLTVIERVAAAGEGELSESAASAPIQRRGVPGLSPRESQILQLILDGHRNEEIARMLFLSPNSVKTFIRLTYRKLGVTTRPQAVLWAVRHGLTEAPPDRPV
jgi:DNA-binding NarL/FixJ family response regulator